MPGEPLPGQTPPLERKRPPKQKAPVPSLPQLGEPFTHGSSLGTTIHLASDEEKSRYAGAEIVKVIEGKDPWEGERAYLELAIAGRLFPGRFIEVVGFEAKDIRAEWDDQEILKYHQRIYSKKADVPVEHAKYTEDMSLTYGNKGKESNCSCGQCATHREFHTQNNLEAQFEDSYGKMKQAGIIPAGELDPSDYCMTPNGIIFFEVGNFYRGEVRNFIDANSGSIENPQEVSELLMRYSHVPTAYDVKSGRA